MGNKNSSERQKKAAKQQIQSKSTQSKHSRQPTAQLSTPQLQQPSQQLTLQSQTTASKPTTPKHSPHNTVKISTSPTTAQQNMQTQPTTASSDNSNSAATLSGSVKENPLVGQWLKNIPLLAKLTDSERAQLGGHLVSRNFSDAEQIIRQGEVGEGFFIIAKGEVIVTRRNETDGTTSELGRLKDGDFFGEAALINNSLRGATVTACGPVQTFYLDRHHFYKLFARDRLNIQFAKRKAITAEQPDEPTAKAHYTPKIPANAIKEKSQATIQLINAAMKDNVLFMNLDSDHKAQIISEMYRCEFNAGQIAIQQGDLGDNLYVVESGEFAVTVNGKQVATRVKATCFGELALMYNSPRAATVTATQPSVVWVVDRFTFRRIVTDLSERRFALYVSFLKRVELLTPLAEYERKKIAEALDSVSFAAGSTIIKQGEQGDAMYIVYDGEVKVSKQEPSGEVRELNRYTTGQYFGERALVTSEPRVGTATAVTTVQLLKLDRNAFVLLLGPLEDIMKKKVESYKEIDLKKDDKFVFVNKVKYEDLKIMGTLGKGSFGHVQLCVDKKSSIPYALKAVSKQQIVQTGQQGHVMSEKKCMATMNHPFMVKLHATYKDKNRLYFLLDPILGGELFSVLREKTLFDEDTARFYAAHVILVFEYMHDRGTVYRDLKPENLLLDRDGYLKVTDFGFAKEIGDGRTWTLCGTPDYLAPEIVSGKGHGKAVDWWTLGVFIYEMLASYPPFYDEDPMKTYQKIMAGNVNFPSHFSKEAVSLIKKLLQHKPAKRLGTLKAGASEIKQHPWFHKFDWNALLQKKLKAPIIPRIKSNIDLSNFEDAKHEKQEIEHYHDDGSNWDADF